MNRYSVALKPLAFLAVDVMEAASYRFAFVSQFGGIFMLLLVTFFLSQLVGKTMLPQLEPYGGNYFSFVLIGVSLATYTSVSLDVFQQSMRRLQVTGTLEVMLGTQTSLSTIVLSSSLYGFLLGTLHVLAYFGAGVVLFGVSVVTANLFSALLVLLLTVFSTAGIGLVAASIAVVIKKGDPVTALFNAGAMVLSGVIYPVNVLPPALQSLSVFLPITHGVEAMRLVLLKGASLQQTLPHLLILAAFAVVLVPAGLLLFHIAVNKARRDASLGHY